MPMDRQQYARLLVAVDYSEHVHTVLARAVALAQRHAAVLHLVHVVEYMPPMVLGDEPFPVTVWPVDDEKLLELAREQMQKLSATVADVTCHEHVVVGTPVQEICNLANDLGIDLIITGSHGRRGIARLLGSTAGALVHETPCDLLLVKIGAEH
jgi:universal stress protein A